MSFKPGVIAIIVDPFNKNTGKMVQLISYLGQSPLYAGYQWAINHGPCWLVDSSSSPIIDRWGQKWNEAPIPQEWLRPISPDETPEESIEAMKLLTSIQEKA